ncbi:hypothetical protein [Streptomyces sp. IB201691-2A2]|uniref:hypothetical protein n=1 Tax=Streptomyces sp. IB201691-2A2 TaxID=2561920 RepID=UPI00117FF802|nr:hypothetical protein [Streptomyces sp. IB201691-2A2]TRO57081.1 hypothetical protein E4K73_44035 [Streptomyces sp. IB201691-2A2]
MERSIVFVHGTGVRAESYNATFEVVRAALGKPGREVRGCFWGAEEGAKFVCGGASVPGYGESGGGRSEADDESIAVWGVLYADPGYELRLLGLRPAPTSGMGRGTPPPRRFLNSIRAYQPSTDAVAAFRTRGLLDDLGDALRTVQESPELRDAAATVDENGYEHRHAVARAVVAATLSAAAERGADAVDGLTRDALLAALSSDLHSQSRALPGKVWKAAAMPALRALTRTAANRRGALSDGVLPMTGDILRYQARGDGVRQLIKRTIEHAPGEAVTVLAHSLGGVACVDLLAMEDLGRRVDQLITVGSQAPFFYECGALASVEHPKTLPGHFPRSWLNIYDPWDLLAYRAAKVFPQHASDIEVSNGQPFPFAHSAYWSNSKVWDAIGTWLN